MLWNMKSLAHLSAFRQNIHGRLLHFLLVIQFSYIIIDFLAYHVNPNLLACVCDCPSPVISSEELNVRHEIWEGKPRICKSKHDFRQERNYLSISNDAHDPWQQMKWVGQPAACSVKGFLIEKLDDRYNFRRGFALKFVADVEDKTHILPWLLATKVDLNLRKRRVYLDLGANRFSTSVRWFLRMYPCDFTEVHAFEANPRSWRPPKLAFDEKGNRVESSNNSIIVKKTPGVAQWMLDRIQVHYQFVADEDDEERKLVNITRFMKEDLNLKSSDTVVVKMDIEGSEWPILKRWMEDPEMPEIIDELFIELHYAHPSMSAFGWNSFASITREDAKNLLADLRWRGFYAHAWP